MKQRLFNKLKKEVNLIIHRIQTTSLDLNQRLKMHPHQNTLLTSDTVIPSSNPLRFKDHEIYTNEGSLLLECFKTGVRTHSISYIRNKVCPNCGSLKPITSESNQSPIKNKNGDSTSTSTLDKSDSAAKISTVIVCEKDNLRMEQTSPGFFYCANGHKKILMNLVPTEQKQEIEKKEKQKRSRVVQIKCPACAKTTEVIRESKIGQKLFRTFACGHTDITSLLAAPLDRDDKWLALYDFQKTGIEFVENANYNALIGDEMGLGKTIQALGTLRYNYNELAPCLMVCESSKVYDWKEEFQHWVGDKYNEIYDEPIIHSSGKFGLCPGFKNHIISMSLLQKPKVLKSILNYGFKFMIIDESHSFKNEDAERTYALQQISKVIPHKLFLSGTPIMNKVMEYFVPLNILQPQHFPSKAYIEQRCDKTSTGRILGLKEYYRPRFFAQTSEYIIRRTKKDAGIKLPNFRAPKHFVNINSDKIFVKSYNDLVDELAELMGKMKQDAGMTSELLGMFAKFRHFVGVAKVKPILHRIEEFLENTDSEDKITIGVHHRDVMSFYERGLKEYNPICISSESPEVKMSRLEQFKRPENRVLIASILGAGQGLNIQFCKNAVVSEREWNPAKEDQFCGRFHRIVKNADGSIKTEFDDAADSVTVDFFNAKGTIDEFFDALIELKKQIVKSTIDSDFAYDPEFLIELAQKIVASKLTMFGTGNND